MSEPFSQPVSLGDYRIPDEREKAIKSHVANLGKTARQVSDQLAFGADVSDLQRVLEANAEDGTNDLSR